MWFSPFETGDSNASTIKSKDRAIAFAAPAAENWENPCAKCPGADGKGQTKVGKKLKVADYTDAKVQAKFTDEQMLKVTAEGAKDDAI